MNNRVIHYADEGQVFAAESCGAHFEVESLSLESCFKFQVQSFTTRKPRPCEHCIPHLLSVPAVSRKVLIQGT